MGIDDLHHLVGKTQVIQISRGGVGGGSRQFSEAGVILHIVHGVIEHTQNINYDKLGL